MNNDIIIQTMTESFEALKDSWETKKDSIIKCIVETEVCDGALAMDMWRYVLKKNENLLRDKNENVNFIDDVIWSFIDKYETDHSQPGLCNILLKHIALHIVNNDTLIKFLFGNVCNAGYSCIGYNWAGHPSEPIPALLACIFLQDSPAIIPVLIKSLASNIKMTDVRVGELILKSNYYLDGIKEQWKWKVGDNYQISDSVKECLLSSLDLIADKEDRAEIALSIMAR